MEKKMKIGFTLGDINGVGPEVLVKALSDHRILQYCTPVIYGSNKILAYYKKVAGTEHFKYASCDAIENANPKIINVINTIHEDIELTPGIENETGARCAFDSLEAAANDLIAGKVDAVVTAPINKHNMQRVGFQFNGHTEYFDYKAGNNGNLMMLMNDQMRIALATHHVPLKDVPGILSEEFILKKIYLLHRSLVEDFAVMRPVIAVLGLNPHAGDNGLLGSDEAEVIIPAIQKAQDKKMLVVGPLAADGLFGSGNYKQYDGILAMYHDQGLVGFKALSFNSGTNFTAGLPFVRTSPDHGTAYDIAGKGIADGGSMLQALYTAIDVIRNRERYHTERENRLIPTPLRSEK